LTSELNAASFYRLPLTAYRLPLTAYRLPLTAYRVNFNNQQKILMQGLEIFADSPAALMALTGVIGLMVGSFLNVVIYRLPIMMQKVGAASASIICSRRMIYGVRSSIQKVGRPTQNLT